MAQAFINAQDYALGSTVADIPELARHYQTGRDLVVAADGNGDHYFDMDTYRDEGFEWLHGLTLSGDLTIAAKIGGFSDTRLNMCNSGTSKSNSYDISSNFRNGEHRATFYVNGNYSSPQSYSDGSLTGVKYHRSEISGNNWKVWINDFDFLPSVSPQIDFTDAKVGTVRAQAGSDGITFTAYNDNIYVYWIGVGTDGDVAPEGGPDYNERKGSTFTVNHTLGTAPDSVTINGLAATFANPTTTTVDVTADAAIATSGEYDLVVEDTVAVTSETFLLQLNVFGIVPSYNPVQKDGSLLANLTGVQARVTDGVNLNGTELFYSGTITTDASGNLDNIDLSSTSVVNADPVLLHLLTPAGDSIIASETIGAL